MKNRLETITNVVLLLMALFVGAVFSYNQFFSRKDPISKQIIGRKLDQAEIGQLSNKRTLVIFLSTKCQFCVASTPFYRMLASTKHDVPIIAAFPQKQEEGRAFLAHQQILLTQVVSAPNLLTVVPGTPTVMLVDQNGKVTDAWVGRLPPSVEHEVLTKIN